MTGEKVDIGERAANKHFVLAINNLGEELLEGEGRANKNVSNADQGACVGACVGASFGLP